MLVLLKKGNKTENRSNLFFGFWQNFAKWSSHSRVSDNECKVRDKTDTARTQWGEILLKEDAQIGTNVFCDGTNVLGWT